MSDPAEAEISHRTAAARLCFMVLALLALVVIHLSLEKGRRPELESFAENTAVGDLEFYRLPAPLPSTPAPATTFEGRALAPVTYRRFELREARMFKVGEDDAHRLRIYATKEPNAAAREGEPERRGEPVYFLKIGPDAFVKVQAAAKGG